jgi:hypothetical protein
MRREQLRLIKQKRPIDSIEAEGKGGRPAISFSYNIARAIIVLLPYPHYSPCSYCY